MSTLEAMKAEVDAVTHRAHVVLDLARRVQEKYATDAFMGAVVMGAAVVVAERDISDHWPALLDDLERYNLIEDTVAYQHRAAELSICNSEIARTLWAVLHGGRSYCQQCIDSLPGEPNEVVAKARGRDTCERHMARAS